jgi:hypothetical protein
MSRRIVQPASRRAFLSVAGLSAVGASLAPAASAAIAKAPAPKGATNPLTIDPRDFGAKASPWPICAT